MIDFSRNPQSRLSFRELRLRTVEITNEDESDGEALLRVCVFGEAADLVSHILAQKSPGFDLRMGNAERLIAQAVSATSRSAF